MYMCVCLGKNHNHMYCLVIAEAQCYFIKEIHTEVAASAKCDHTTMRLCDLISHQQTKEKVVFLVYYIFMPGFNPVFSFLCVLQLQSAQFREYFHDLSSPS